jgi:hypothetical protein
MNRHSLVTIALFSSSLCCVGIACAQTPTPPPSQEAPGTSPPATPKGLQPIPKGPIGDVDQLFLDSYLSRRTDVIKLTSPFIVVSGSTLILHRNDVAEPPVRVIPDLYHALKDVAHVPFAIYLQLSPVAETGTDLTDDQLKEMKLFQNKIDAARDVLATGGYTPDELARQKQILEASENLVVSTLNSNKVSKSNLAAFAKAIGPLMLSNAWDAGCAQVKSTHAQVMIWKSQLSKDEWNRLIAVNVARHQARYRNAATQYFHWLIGDDAPSWNYPGESMRVIFAETLGKSPDGKDEHASDELGTILVDANASNAFFGDPWRLSEDILSDGAAACIKELPAVDRIHP